MSYYVFRDPIHGNIYLQHGKDDVLMEIINSSPFQRLRRISQLGTVYLTYPGAEHSRFSHSLGTLHIVTLALNHLRQNASDEFKPIIDEYFERTRIAALVHDIGHGPFSHTFENIEPIFTRMHEEWTVKILRESTEIVEILQKYHINVEDIVAMIEKKAEQPIFSELIGGHLDVDRMDYLLRDSHHTGVKYGIFDWERILASLIPIEFDGIYHLGLNQKGIHSMEEFILSRYFMYEQVYLHKTVLSTEFLLQKIFQRIYDLVDKEKLTITHPVLKKLFHNETLSVEEYLLLDDHLMYTFFTSFLSDKDTILADLCNRFLKRRLLKVKTCKTKDEYKALVNEAKKKGFDPTYYIGELNSSLTPYPKLSTANTYLMDFPVKMNNQITTLSAVSPIIKKFQGFTFERIMYAYPEELFH